MQGAILFRLPQVGDPVRLKRYAGERITALEMFRDFYDPDLNVETLRRYLAAPTAIRDRVMLPTPNCQGSQDSQVIDNMNVSHIMEVNIIMEVSLHISA